MKLLIRNLSRDTTEADLKDLFEGYGTVQFCNLVLDKTTRKSKGFAFVEMPKHGEAKAAMKNLNGRHIDNNVIRVKKADTNEPSASNESSTSNESSASKEPSANKEPVSNSEAPASPYKRKKR